MGFILSIIAYLLLIPTALANFVVVTYKNIKTEGFLKSMNTFWFNNALELDILMNFHFRSLWNVILKGFDGYSFGKKGETISSALGKNQRDKTLSIGGKVMVAILHAVDFKYWFKGGHCLNSIKK
jgi:hypothetical protein